MASKDFNNKIAFVQQMLSLYIQHYNFILDLKDENDDTLLMLAARGGLTDVVELLLEKRVDATRKNKEGKTVFEVAAEHQAQNPSLSILQAWKACRDCLHLILKNTHRPDVRFTETNETVNKDYTPLHMAVMHGYTDIVEILLKYHANPFITVTHNGTPLSTAREWKRQEILDLIEPVADKIQKYFEATSEKEINEYLRDGYVDVEDEHGITKFALELLKGNYPLFTHLLDRGAKLNHKQINNKYKSYLHMIVEADIPQGAMENALLYMSWLIGQGININIQDEDGNTPLHSACGVDKGESKEFIKLLIERGAKTDIPNNRNVTIDDAIKKHPYDTIYVYAQTCIEQKQLDDTAAVKPVDNPELNTL